MFLLQTDSLEMLRLAIFVFGQELTAAAAARRPLIGKPDGYQPPDIAPTIRNGWAAVRTGCGSGKSGESCDRSCSQAKKRR